MYVLVGGITISKSFSFMERVQFTSYFGHVICILFLLSVLEVQKKKKSCLWETNKSFNQNHTTSTHTTSPIATAKVTATATGISKPPATATLFTEGWPKKTNKKCLGKFVYLPKTLTSIKTNKKLSRPKEYKKCVLGLQGGGWKYNIKYNGLDCVTFFSIGNKYAGVN